MDAMSTPSEHTLRVQQLFVANQGALRAFVLSLWPDVAEADDVMQEVFLTITAKADRFREGTNFLSWARTVARYEVCEARRARARTMLRAEVLAVLEADCPRDFGDSRRLAALARCLEKLPPKAREVVQLRYHQELGAGEIARTLARSVNGVSVALAKARVALRACMEQQLGPETA
jgi:RNA polymerase sigma-70 factor (ECF subfamily)